MEDIEKKEIPASQSRNEEQPAGGDAGKKYVVRHNKEEVQLTFDELLKNAEKGLDYDRIRPSHELVKELAAKNGESDVARFIAKMKNGQSGDTPAAKCPQPQRGAVKNEEMEAIAKEYPEYLKNGEVELPPNARSLYEGGMDILNACRVNDLRCTKELCARLSAKLNADNANREGAAASIGSLSGGETPQKDYYTSKEWDSLPAKEKEKFIKNGKVYKFMKKWSGK